MAGHQRFGERQLVVHRRRGDPPRKRDLDRRAPISRVERPTHGEVLAAPGRLEPGHPRVQSRLQHADRVIQLGDVVDLLLQRTRAAGRHHLGDQPAYFVLDHMFEPTGIRATPPFPHEALWTTPPYSPPVDNPQPRHAAASAPTMSSTGAHAP